MPRVPTKRIIVRVFGPDGTRVVIGDTTSDVQLVTDFSCVMTTKPERNAGRVTIANLPDSIRNQLARAVSTELGLFEHGDFVSGVTAIAGSGATETAQADATLLDGRSYCTVDAGEDGEVGRVFEGSIESIRSSQSGPDWTTEILISDGQATAGVEVDTSWPANVQLYDVLNFVRKSMSLELGNFTKAQFLASIGKVTKSRISRPFAIKRSANSIMAEIFTLTGAEWWVDRGAMYVVRKGQPLADRAIVLANEQGGLRGRPEQLDKSASAIMSDFRRGLRVGRRTVVDYEGVRTELRADQVAHSLNNYDGDFASAAILRQIPKDG